MTELLQVSEEVAAALEGSRPVVALETSIVGQGLPAPHNLQAALRCEAAIRHEGAVPATVAVLDGRLRVGLGDAELERIAGGGAVKVSSRDLGPAVAQGWVGATTVAATMRIASMAGVRFLATGGIGGVHRGHPEDQSADLEELGHTPVAVFCAGAKIILDLSSTLERLDSLAVPVLGYECDEFPAFYTRHGEGRVRRVDGAEETARVLHAAWSTGARGVVIAIPPPWELEGAQQIAEQALSQLGEVHGGDVTPRLLSRMAELTGGRSVALNVELVINNARIGAQVARAFFA